MIGNVKVLISVVVLLRKYHWQKHRRWEGANLADFVAKKNERARYVQQAFLSLMPIFTTF
jgi:hypothetical protein